MIGLHLRHFNTSHVNVNHRNSFKHYCNSIHFNTSHVNVNQNYSVQNLVFQFYFNTSHVNVNLNNRRRHDRLTFISIHLMLMLIDL